MEAQNPEWYEPDTEETPSSQGTEITAFQNAYKNREEADLKMIYENSNNPDEKEAVGRLLKTRTIHDQAERDQVAEKAQRETDEAAIAAIKNRLAT